MPKITLESLAARLAAVEKTLAENTAGEVRKKDWRRSVGMFDDDPDFLKEVIAEGQAICEADREAGRLGEHERSCSTPII